MRCHDVVMRLMVVVVVNARRGLTLNSGLAVTFVTLVTLILF